MIEMLNADRTAKICPVCNAENKLDTKECIVCGYEFKDTNSSPATPGDDNYMS